jgi:septal ring factor EnvC (AmiA/AmiB activator)
MDAGAMRRVPRTHRERYGRETEMPKIVERIGVLEERLKQLKAKQQKIDARRRALETRQARQADTRRKFLAGAIVLSQIESDAVAEAKFRQWLDASLTGDEDRALFDLPPVSREPASVRPPSQRDREAADAIGADSSLADDQH